MIFKQGTLVLVMDGGAMRVFRNRGDSVKPVLEQLDERTLDNPQTSDQGSDTPGRSQSSVGDHRSSYEETDWHQQAEDRFAAEAADLLEQATSQHDGAIVVFAAPRSLGVLRQHYGPATRERLSAEIAKDMTNSTNEQILAAIAAHSSSGG